MTELAIKVGPLSPPRASLWLPGTGSVLAEDLGLHQWLDRTSWAMAATLVAWELVLQQQPQCLSRSRQSSLEIRGPWDLFGEDSCNHRRDHEEPWFRLCWI